MESLRAEYTEVWCAERNVPLVRFADRVRSIGAAGLDRLGLLPADDVVTRLREFDSIVSWYGAGRTEFVGLVRGLGLPVQFLSALPARGRHAVDFYNAQAMALGASRPSRFPSIPCPAVARTFAAIHPFASSAKKRAPMGVFESLARRLEGRMPVQWFCGPEETLSGAERIEDLYDLACRLRGARVFIGNDSGISHLAAAVGTPTMSLFVSTDARVWSARGIGSVYSAF